MQIDHSYYGLPQQIGPIKIQPITWQHFKASPPHTSRFLAHIYWSVNYEFGNVSQGQPKVRVNVNIRPKSWKLVQQLQLLKHEYGHYMIGCLCGLSFARKVNYDLVWNPKTNFGNWCKEILNQCLRQYCEMEKLYDEQTEHYMNKEMQLSWENKIREEFLNFEAFFKTRESNGSKKTEQRLAQVSNNILDAGGSNKIQVQSAGSNKIRIKKQFNNDSLKLKTKQTTSSKKSIKSKNEVQFKIQMITPKTNLLFQKRQYKKMEANDSIHANKMPPISKRVSLPMQPLTTWLKPL